MESALSWRGRARGRGERRARVASWGPLRFSWVTRSRGGAYGSSGSLRGRGGRDGVRQGPDDEEVDGHHDHRPDRRVRQEQELRHQAQRRQRDAGGPGPLPAREDAPADHGGDDAEDEQDPPPADEADLVDVVADPGVDVVLDDGGDALEHGEDAVQQEQDTGEGRAPGGPGGALGGGRPVAAPGRAGVWLCGHEAPRFSGGGWYGHRPSASSTLRPDGV